MRWRCACVDLKVLGWDFSVGVQLLLVVGIVSRRIVIE